ncbi:MAG: PilZ domain-containing protein [Candidatus Acidiferrales bacterium]
MGLFESIPLERLILDSWPKVERRDSRRSKMGMAFRIWFDGMWLDPNGPKTGRTKDCSKNGIYFVSLPGNYRRGMSVRVAFDSGNEAGDSWRIPGRIVRVVKIPDTLYGIAVEFLDRYKP